MAAIDDDAFKECFCQAKTLLAQSPKFPLRYAKAAEFFP